MDLIQFTLNDKTIDKTKYRVRANDDGTLTIEHWDLPIKQPSDALITSNLEKFHAYNLAQEYSHKRAMEYPSIGDQLDALWKGGQAKADMELLIQAVKTNNPKI